MAYTLFCILSAPCAGNAQGAAFAQYDVTCIWKLTHDQSCPFIPHFGYKAWLQPSALCDSQLSCRVMVTTAWGPLLRVSPNKCKLLRSPIHRPLPSSRPMATFTLLRLTLTLARASALVIALEIWLRFPHLLLHRSVVVCPVTLCAAVLFA